jgi:hypothetical protein
MRENKFTMNAFVAFIISLLISFTHGNLFRGVTPTPTPTPMVRQATSLSGKYVCLPHKNKSGPQTLECAFGLQTNDGLYYALDTNAIPQADVMNIQVGQQFKLDGLLVPIEEISSNQMGNYDIRGIMKVESFTKL